MKWIVYNGCIDEHCAEDENRMHKNWENEKIIRITAKSKITWDNSVQSEWIQWFYVPYTRLIITIAPSLWMWNQRLNSQKLYENVVSFGSSAFIVWYKININYKYLCVMLSDLFVPNAAEWGISHGNWITNNSVYSINPMVLVGR